MLLLCFLFYNFASRKKEIIDKLKTNCYEIKNGNMV